MTLCHVVAVIGHRPIKKKLVGILRKNDENICKAMILIAPFAPTDRELSNEYGVGGCTLAEHMSNLDRREPVRLNFWREIGFYLENTW